MTIILIIACILGLFLLYHLMQRVFAFVYRDPETSNLHCKNAIEEKEFSKLKHRLENPDDYYVYKSSDPLS